MKNNRNCNKCYWEQFFTSNPEDDIYCAKCKDFSMWKSKTITQNYISREEIDNLLVELDKPENLTIITIENIRQKIKKL